MPLPCVNQACVNRVCVGTCTPGSTQCLVGGAETCDSTGNWTGTCDGGLCDAGSGACSADAGQAE
jgi:hypothetical protein